MRWGQWPITIIRWAAESTENTGYGEIRLLERRLSALADSLAILVIFLIGRRLYSARTGLLAAALSALAVMQIQQSHFMTVDNFGTLFAALAMYTGVRVAQSEIVGRRRPVFGRDKRPASSDSAVWIRYIFFGVAFGMAVASRINLLPLGGILLLATLISITDGIPDIRSGLRKKGMKAGFYVVLAFVTAFLTFRVTQPMSFRAPTGDTTVFTLDLNPDWVDSMEVARNESRGIGAGPPGEQWTNRPAIIFPLVNMVLWGMGLPLGLTVWVGAIWASRRTLRVIHDAWPAHLLPLVWVGGYFLFTGTRHVMSVRYFLPIYPFLCLFAAWALMARWRLRTAIDSAGHDGNVGSWNSPTVLRGSFTSLLLTGIVLFGTLAWAGAFVNAVYVHDHTRVRATRDYSRIDGFALAVCRRKHFQGSRMPHIGSGDPSSPQYMDSLGPLTRFSDKLLADADTSDLCQGIPFRYLRREDSYDIIGASTEN